MDDSPKETSKDGNSDNYNIYNNNDNTKNNISSSSSSPHFPSPQYYSSSSEIEDSVVENIRVKQKIFTANVIKLINNL